MGANPLNAWDLRSELVQAAKRQARAQASFGRGMAPDAGAMRNLHKRKGGGARRSDYYGD